MEANLLRETIAGGCLATTLGALVYLFHQYRASQESRIAELKESGKMAVALVEKMAPLVERLLDQEDRRR